MLNIEGLLTIYMDKRKAIRTLRLRCLCAFPICLVMFVLSGMSPDAQDIASNLMRWALLAEAPVLYFLISKRLTRQTEPILSVSSRGITVNTLGSRIGFLHWDEIKEIYSYRLGERFVGITLNNSKAVYARIGLKHSLMLRMNDLVIPLFKLFRIRAAPINILQQYLPMTGDELLAEIESYRATYS